MTRAMAAVPLRVETGLATLPVGRFASTFSRVLPGLLKFMRSGELQKHPKWGKLMPYKVPAYGSSSSIGHICRPDIVLTPQGPRITEIDFVPSGRGWTLLGIPTAAGRREHLEAYRRWYGSMGFGSSKRPVYYATGSTTVCKEETDLFAAEMRRMGVSVESVNIDTDRLGPPGLIDRLFYRGELARPFQPGKHSVITAEPWFDSKMIFAVIHDRAMTDVLTRYVGADGLSFLRQVFIPTYLLEDVLREDKRMPRAYPNLRIRRDIIDNRSRWVLKSTDVEEAWSWGARSVIIGSRVGLNVWEGVVRFANGNPSRKELGRHPILQEFCHSMDFGSLWNGMAAGKLQVPNPARLGKASDAVTKAPTKRHVFARVGVYFLVNNHSAQVFTPPHGVLTLRQDPLAHGASDAIITAFKIA